MNNPQSNDGTIHYSFNVPFAADLAGPDTEDILHATTDAVLRWTHPEDAPDDVQLHELPVHAQNLANLERMCRDLSNGPLPIEAHVVSSPFKAGRGQQVTTVCLSGSPELVHKSRETILNETPIALVCVDAWEPMTEDLAEVIMLTLHSVAPRLMSMAPLFAT
jgi:hypothetical protein